MPNEQKEKKVMNTIKNRFKTYFTKSVDKVLKEANAMAEDPVTDMPEDSETMADGDAAALENTTGDELYNKIQSDIEALPDEGDTSYDQILSLGEKYATYFEKTRDIIQKLQAKQMQNEFEDVLKVKFLPLSKALSTMIDELRAGIADRVHDKQIKAAKDNGAKV